MTLPPWWALVAGPLVSGSALTVLALWLAGAFDNWTYRPRRLPMAHSPKQEKA